MTMHGWFPVVVEEDPDPAIIQRALDRGFLDVRAGSLADAIALAEAAKAEGRALGIGVHGNAAEAFPTALAMGWLPDIISEMCPCHDPLSYIPAGLTPEAAADLRATDRGLYLEKARESMHAPARRDERVPSPGRAGLRVRHQHPQGVSRRGCRRPRP